MAGDGDGDGRRIVFFPCPIPGHDTPMLLLAGALHARGFAVTVFHTELRAPDPADYPADYRFVPLCAEVPQEVVASDDIMRLSTGLNDSSEAAWKDRLVAALAAEGTAMNDTSEAPWKDRLVAALAAEGTAMNDSSEAPWKDRLVAALAAEGTAMNDTSEAPWKDRLVAALAAEGTAMNDSSEAPWKDRLVAALAAEGTAMNDTSEAPWKDRLVAALAAEGTAMNDSSEAPWKDRLVAALAAEGTAMNDTSEAPWKDRLVAALAAEGTAMNDTSEAPWKDRLVAALAAEGTAMTLIDSSEAPFKDRLAAALAAEGAGVRCVITDVVWYRAQAVARSLGVPVLGFMTGSAANFWTYMRYTNLIAEGYLSGQAAPDLLVRLIIAGARQSSGLILHTLGEAADLGKIRDGLSVPVFAVAALNKVVPPPANTTSSSSLYDWNSTVEAMSEGVELAAATVIKTVIKKMVADKEIREGMDGLRLAAEEAIIDAQKDLIALVDLIKSF